MTIQFKGTGMELSESIKEYAEKRLHSLEKLLPESARLYVDLGKPSGHHKNGDVFRAEMQCDVPGGLLRAEALSEDLYKSIDRAREDLDRQLVKRKEKQMN